jgi:hypothetical protein
MAPIADDGTDQDFGLAAQSPIGAFKQGWGGDDDGFDSEQLNSTGLLDGNRYAVAILVQHVPYESMSTLLPQLNAVAAAIAPNGKVVSGAAALPAPAPTSTGPAAGAPTSPATAPPAAVGRPNAEIGGRATTAGTASSSSARRLAHRVRLDAVAFGGVLLAGTASLATLRLQRRRKRR